MRLLGLLLCLCLMGCVTNYQTLNDIPESKREALPSGITKIQRGMSKEQIWSILGTPEIQRGVSDRWKINGQQFSQIVVYYADGYANAASYISANKNVRVVLFQP